MQRRACANSQTRQSFLCSHTQTRDVDEHSGQKKFSLALENNRASMLKHNLAIGTKRRLKSPIYGFLIRGFALISVNDIPRLEIVKNAQKSLR